jgi:hypothetical protein
MLLIIASVSSWYQMLNLQQSSITCVMGFSRARVCYLFPVLCTVHWFITLEEMPAEFYSAQKSDLCLY